LSVEAVQDKLICVEEAAVATRFVGAVGGVVSAGGVEVEFGEPHPPSKNTEMTTKRVKSRHLFATRTAFPLFMEDAEGDLGTLENLSKVTLRIGGRHPLAESYHARLVVGI
jgi:hypothetical protein